MLTNKRSMVFFILLGISVFFILGCSKSNETAKRNNTLEEIKKRGKVIVGTEAVTPPYEFMQNGKIVGYGADILAEIVKNLGVELEQHDVEWNGILPGLESKKFDFIATAVAVTPERKEKYNLTTPIGEFIHVFSKKARNLELNSREDLADKKIGCITNSINEKLLKEFKEQLEKEGKPTFEMVYFKGTPDAFLDLENGRIDAVLSSETTAKAIMGKNSGKYEIFADLGDGKKDLASWAVRKEDKELLEFLNTEIIKMKKSGKLAELQEKWFGRTFDLPDEI